MADRVDLEPDSQAPVSSGPPPWLNAALTGVVMASVLVAALSHYAQPLDPVDDIVWTLLLLGGSSVIRTYAAFVTSRAGRERHRDAAKRILRGEWALVCAGLPAVAALLTSISAHWSTRGTVQFILVMNVVVLFVLGIAGASRAGHRASAAIGFGLGDAALGLLVIVFNSTLR